MSQRAVLLVLLRKREETIGLSAHVDTLGAMVGSIDSNGTLRFTMVGDIPCIVLKEVIVRYILEMAGIYWNNSY